MKVVRLKAGESPLQPALMSADKMDTCQPAFWGGMAAKMQWLLVDEKRARC